MKTDTNRWCILRTSGGKTLPLVRSLADADLDAWTPIERVRRRVPRAKMTEHFVTAFAPTYVFVRERHLPELQRMEGAIGGVHPRFSIFRYYGNTVFVPHAALHPLRRREQDSYIGALPVVNRQTKHRGKAYGVGEQVTFEGGPLSGLNCMIASSDGLETTITLTLFGREAGVKIKTSKMRAARVSVTEPAA
uniref:hypothetical protein n=1 Tax=uncultured Sphingomonas sp. TaxID=158754 RepID=UPI0035CB9932